MKKLKTENIIKHKIFILSKKEKLLYFIKESNKAITIIIVYTWLNIIETCLSE